MTKKWFLILGIFSIATVLILLDSSSPTKGSLSYRDFKKIRSVKELQLGLDLYGGDNENLYPPIQSKCTDSEILKAYLTPKYLNYFPQDDSHSFQVAISADRKSYILRTVLEDRKRTELEHDIDGNIMGCDCDDPNYCIINK